MDQKIQKTLEAHLDITQREFDEIRKFVVGDSGDIARLQMCRLSFGPRLTRSSVDGGNGMLRGSCVHVVMNDVPGTGKTLKAKVLADITGGKFSRIQCTPDLTPTQILGGYRVIDGQWQLEYGPIYANVILVDEINRATPRTQSALLEAMGEGKVSYTRLGGKDGAQEKSTVFLPVPFQVLATQNPIEQEGVEELPEAQMDRLGMSLMMPRYTLDELDAITKKNEDYESMGVEKIATLENLDERRVFIQEHVLVTPEMRSYVSRLVLATHNPFQNRLSDERKRAVKHEKEFRENWEYIWRGTKLGKYSLSDLIKMGSSPRGAIFLLNISRSTTFLAYGREKRSELRVIPKDIKKIAVDVLAHRVWLTDQGKMVADEFGGEQELRRRLVGHIVEYVEW